jgi:hypothetical protein
MYDPVDMKMGKLEELREGADAGDGLAVVVQAARPASGAVRDWVMAAGLPIRSLVAIEPTSGISDQAIGDAATRRRGDRARFRCRSPGQSSATSPAGTSESICSSPGLSASQSCSVSAGTA